MLKHALIGIFFATATPAIAAGVLWQNIEIGMTQLQIETLYPEGPTVKHRRSWTVIKDVLVAGCKGQAIVSYKAGTVSRVDIAGGGCEGPLLQSLMGKYGRPLGDDVNHVAPEKLLSDTNREAIWRDGPRIIRYKGTSNGIFGSWQLRYAPISDDGI